MKIGSLFSGYGGLDMAVAQVTGATTVWVSDIDKGACKILAQTLGPDHAGAHGRTIPAWETDRELVDNGGSAGA